VNTRGLTELYPSWPARAFDSLGEGMNSPTEKPARWIIERVVSGSGVALNGGHVIPFLVAVAVDDHLAIRFPVALPDDHSRCPAASILNGPPELDRSHPGPLYG
jgi:hypothetical protein